MINFDECLLLQKTAIMAQNQCSTNLFQGEGGGGREIRMTINFTQMLTKQMFLNNQPRAI